MNLLLKNIHIYEPKDLGVQDILIVDQKIAAIEKQIQLQIQDIEVIDCTGLIATPGLIDQHVHLIGGGGEGGFPSRVPEIQLTQLIEGGITTVVGLLGTDVYTRTIEDLLAKTKALNIEGITAYCLTGGYKYPPVTLTGSVEKDIIFIDEIIGLKLAISDHRSSYPTTEEITRVATQVRLASLISGKQGYIHLHLGNEKKGLEPIFDVISDTELPIDLFRPTHVNKIFDHAISFGKLGGRIDLTVGTSLEKNTHMLDGLSQVVNQDLITISSDANGSLPKWDHLNNMVGLDVSHSCNLLKTLQFLVLKENFHMSHALQYCTSNVAMAIGKYPQKGTLRASSDADIILFDQQLNIVHLISKGQFMIKNTTTIKKGTFEGS